MRQYTDEQIILDAQAAVAKVFTADSTTDTLTSAAHGLSNGNLITVANAGGGLPAGLAADTYYYVVGVTANTFQLSLTPGGAAIDITTNGTGTQTAYKEFVGQPILLDSFEFLELQIDTSGSADVTLFSLTSGAGALPSWLNPQSASNRYAFVQLIDHIDSSGVDGNVGIVTGGVDIHKLFKLNVDGQRWFNIRTKDFKAGTLSIRAKPYNLS